MRSRGFIGGSILIDLGSVQIGRVIDILQNLVQKAGFVTSVRGLCGGILSHIVSDVAVYGGIQNAIYYEFCDFQQTP